MLPYIANDVGRGDRPRLSPGVKGAEPPVEISVVSTPAALALARRAPTVSCARWWCWNRIEVVEPHRVAVRYFVDLRIRQVCADFHNISGACGQGASEWG